MKYFCLSFDIEEFDVPLEFNKSISEEDMFGISNKGTKRIIRLLDNRRLKATFFTTARFAIKYPSLIKEISKKHEIGLHGYNHNSDYGNMHPSEALKELIKAKKEIEKITSKKIYGFRAPRMSSVSTDVLKKLGVEYDSSLNPTYVPRHYNNLFEPRKIFEKEGIIIIPASVVPIIRAPIAWVWFRNLGLSYAKFCTRLCLLADNYAISYFHPWEFVSLAKLDIPLLFKRNTGINIYNNLDKYIGWLMDKKIKFITMKNLAEKFS